MAKQLTPAQQAAKDAAKQRVADQKAKLAADLQKQQEDEAALEDAEADEQQYEGDDDTEGTTGADDAGKTADGPDVAAGVEQNGQDAGGDAPAAEGSDAPAAPEPGDTSGSTEGGVAAPETIALPATTPSPDAPHDCAGLIAALQGKLDEANATINAMQNRMNTFEALLKSITVGLNALGVQVDKRGTLHGHIDDLPKVT